MIVVCFQVEISEVSCLARVLPSVVCLNVFVKPRQWGGPSPLGVVAPWKRKWCCLFWESVEVPRRQDTVFILQHSCCSVTESEKRDSYCKMKNLCLEQRQCKAMPCQVFRDPGGLRLPDFLDNRHMKQVRLWALHTGRFYLQEISQALISTSFATTCAHVNSLQ